MRRPAGAPARRRSGFGQLRLSGALPRALGLLGVLGGALLFQRLALLLVGARPTGLLTHAESVRRYDGARAGISRSAGGLRRRNAARAAARASIARVLHLLRLGGWWGVELRDRCGRVEELLFGGRQLAVDEALPIVQVHVLALARTAEVVVAGPRRFRVPPHHRHAPRVDLV